MLNLDTSDEGETIPTCSPLMESEKNEPLSMVICLALLNSKAATLNDLIVGYKNYLPASKNLLGSLCDHLAINQFSNDFPEHLKDDDAS